MIFSCAVALFPWINNLYSSPSVYIIYTIVVGTEMISEHFQSVPITINKFTAGDCNGLYYNGLYL